MTYELLGILVSVFVPGIGVVFAVGKLFQRVKDHDEEFADMKTRLDKLEMAALQVGQLATAIEHMSERFASQIAHLVNTMGVQNDHVRGQLADLKEDIRSIKMPRTRRTGDA